MNSFLCSAGVDKYRVEALCTICGEDLCITIGGGEAPHIGACAFACPPERGLDQKKTSATVSVLRAPDHQEDLLAREWALRLTTAFSRRVCIAAGIHINGASRQEITLLLENTNQALTDVENRLLKDFKEE
ncbi:MAG: hypothetical protein PVH64_09790 [Bacillota bacterium]